MSIEVLLAELGDESYTREQFEKDLARLLARLCAKHSIAESEVEALIRDHRYTHTFEDPEGEYTSLMAIASIVGWT